MTRGASVRDDFVTSAACWLAACHDVLMQKPLCGLPHPVKDAHAPHSHLLVPAASVQTLLLFSFHYRSAVKRLGYVRVRQ